MNLRANDVFYQERLNRSAAVLSIAYGVFLKFCIEKGWNVELTAKGFSAVMENLLEHQIKDLNLHSKDEPNYIVELYQLFKFEQDLGFVQTGRPKNIWKAKLNYHDMHEFVYILSDKMGKMMREIGRKFGGPMSIHRLLDALDHEGIIVKDNNKNGTRSKKEGGRRCYVLDYARWERYMQEEAKEWDEEIWPLLIDNAYVIFSAIYYNP